MRNQRILKNRRLGSSKKSPYSGLECFNSIIAKGLEKDLSVCIPYYFDKDFAAKQTLVVL